MSKIKPIDLLEKKIAKELVEYSYLGDEGSYSMDETTADSAAFVSVRCIEEYLKEQVLWVVWRRKQCSGYDGYHKWTTKKIIAICSSESEARIMEKQALRLELKDLRKNKAGWAKEYIVILRRKIFNFIKSGTECNAGEALPIYFTERVLIDSLINTKPKFWDGL